MRENQNVPHFHPPQVLYFQEHPIEIIDDKGDRWIPSQQVGHALGSTRIRALVSELTQSSELVDGKHFRTLTVRKTGRGNPNILALSYRGVIRVAMRSDGQRAKEFRDWAEDVLFQVMTSGSYGESSLAGKVETLSRKMDLLLKTIRETEEPPPGTLQAMDGPLMVDEFGQVVRRHVPRSRGWIKSENKEEYQKFIDLYRRGYTADQIHPRVGVSRATVYRWIQKLQRRGMELEKEVGHE